MDGYPYALRFSGSTLSSHPTMQAAMDAAADAETRHGIPLHRMEIIDRREGRAWPRVTLERERIGIVGTPHSN